MARRVIVSGGSLGGLFAAAALSRAGWEVAICERSPVPLSGRGAGLVTHVELEEALSAVGASTEALGVETQERVAYDRAGARVAAFDFHQVVTSWDRLYQVLRAAIPGVDYRLGRTITGYRDHETHVEVLFADGGSETADLLVGADGFRSAIRAQMLPGVVPEYSGYVVWRTLASEADLSAEIRADIFRTFGFYHPHGTAIVGYPICGPGNDLRPGHRRYNFVWYFRVAPGALGDMLTDARGQRHDLTIPPPAIRDDTIAAMQAEAERLLPPPFVEILRQSARPFFTPIYDLHSPVMARGRVALAGDAACVARPHVGMGVTKAAEDALALARLLDGAPVPGALARYSEERTPICRTSFEVSRWLGKLMFGGKAGLNPDGCAHPALETLMRETAVVPAALRR